jgi:hypothetical protein
MAAAARDHVRTVVTAAQVLTLQKHMRTAPLMRLYMYSDVI